MKQKIVSCDCFDQIIKNVKEGNGSNVELSMTGFSMESNKAVTVEPVIYFKTGKDGIKKKDYIYMKCSFCPSCGKKIEFEKEQEDGNQE